MSQAITIPSKEIRSWLHQKTKSKLLSIQKEAQGLLEEMESELEEVTQVAQMLFKKSQKELEKKSEKTSGRAKALNKLSKLFVKRMEKIELPQEVSYQSFNSYVQTAKKAFVSTEVDIKNWFPRISPYFIWDRRKFEGVYEEAKESLKKLQKFLTQEYVEVKVLEETFQLIDDLLTYEKELAKLKARKKEACTNQVSLRQEIAEVKRKMEDTREQGGLNRIDHLTKELKKLKRKVRRKLRHLQKPIEKLQRMALRKGGLSSEESRKLRRYAEKPFHAFSTEKKGYTFLKRILKTIDKLIEKGELNLKPRRREKAKEDIDHILNKNSLATLHKECRETVMEKKGLSNSAKTKKAKRKLRELQKNLKKNKRRKKRVDLEKGRIERNLKDTWKKVHRHQEKIEKKLSNFLERKITIQLTG